MFLTSHRHDLLSLPQQELSLDKKVVNNRTEHRKPLETVTANQQEQSEASRASITRVLESRSAEGRQPHVNNVHSTRVWVCGLFIEQSERDR